MRYDLETLSGLRTLLVASTGGHLNQLVRLEGQLDPHADSTWVTFDTPQSRSLLDGRNVLHVPYVSPRDWRGVIRARNQAKALIRDFDAAISTGAGLALAILPEVALRGKPAVYVESISRVAGPSVTGRMMRRLPQVGLYAQHGGWARPPWRFGPSVLSGYKAIYEEPGSAPERIFVTLGTIAPYRFDRLVDHVLRYAETHPGVEIRWQLGCTTRSDLPGEVFTELGENEFKEALSWADVVVAHAGVGVVMNILDQGKIPLLGVRDPRRMEHVDGHQRQIKDYLVSRGLARSAPDALRNESLLRVVTASRVKPISKVP